MSEYAHDPIAEAEAAFVMVADYLGTSVLHQIFLEARQEQEQGNDGVVLEDECDGGEPTIALAVGRVTVDFRIDGRSFSLPVEQVFELLPPRPEGTAA